MVERLCSRVLFRSESLQKNYDCWFATRRIHWAATAITENAMTQCWWLLPISKADISLSKKAHLIMTRTRMPRWLSGSLFRRKGFETWTSDTFRVKVSTRHHNCNSDHRRAVVPRCLPEGTSDSNVNMIHCRNNNSPFGRRPILFWFRSTWGLPPAVPAFCYPIKNSLHHSRTP